LLHAIENSTVCGHCKAIKKLPQSLTAGSPGTTESSKGCFWHHAIETDSVSALQCITIKSFQKSGE